MPTCNCLFRNVPSRISSPLYRVLVDTRVISWISRFTSFCKKVLSAELFVPLAAWIASSRIRWSMSETSPMAPSTDLVMAMPSLAFFTAMDKPRTWAVIRWVIARPAASSDAALIFRPVDSRSIAVLSSPLDSASARCEVRDDTLVFITRAIVISVSYSLVSFASECSANASNSVF